MCELAGSFVTSRCDCHRHLAVSIHAVFKLANASVPTTATQCQMRGSSTFSVPQFEIYITSPVHSRDMYQNSPQCWSYM
jgi:hypothetical protein